MGSYGRGQYFSKVQQDILNAGKADTGIIAVEGFDYEIIEKMYWTHDNLGIAVTLKADGSIEKNVIASITESLALDSENEEQWGRLLEIFTDPGLQIVSFTITEKGYSLVNAKGEYYPEVAYDFENGLEKPKSYIGKVAGLLYARYKAGNYPITMQSMDNCSHNGDKLYAAVTTFAEKWGDEDFLSYVTDKGKVSFPRSMIDKITPRPDENVKNMLMEAGFEELNTSYRKKYICCAVC